MGVVGWRVELVSKAEGKKIFLFALHQNSTSNHNYHNWSSRGEDPEQRQQFSMCIQISRFKLKSETDTESYKRIANKVSNSERQILLKLLIM